MFESIGIFSDLDQGAACSGATAGASGAHEPSAPSATVITLEKLFRQASLQHESNARFNYLMFVFL